MIFDPILDIFRGKAVTVPPMDGALKPNTALDDAPALLEIEAPDNLCTNGEDIVFSSGNQLFSLAAGGEAHEISRFNTAVTALAFSPAGELAIALETGVLRLMTREGALRDLVSPAKLGCVTALVFDAKGALYLAQGSARHAAGDWAVDLMEKNAEGSVWRIDPATGTATALRQGLAFPNGLLVQNNGSGLVVAEGWKHRLIGVSGDGSRAPDPILSKLPGYPARLSPSGDGGAWLALFAPRNRLIEFTLLEDTYREQMMRDVPREYWIAPALASGASFLEPLQCGGVRTMGVHKPWSPTRSYGLVVKLDAALRPTASYHSRANGRRHGVTSVVEAGGRVLAASKGGNAILDLTDAVGSEHRA
jgi:sugar lactone lactonase YvrE